MIIEIACLLIGILVGFIGSCIFNAIMSLSDRERISHLWKLLIYYGGTTGIPPIISFIIEKPSSMLYISYYIIGLVIAFIFNVIIVYVGRYIHRQNQKR